MSKPKYKVGDIVLTSNDADGWGSDKLVNNRSLKIKDIVPVQDVPPGVLYFFEGGLQTREECIVALIEPAADQLPFPLGSYIKISYDGGTYGDILKEINWTYKPDLSLLTLEPNNVPLNVPLKVLGYGMHDESDPIIIVGFDTKFSIVLYHHKKKSLEFNKPWISFLTPCDSKGNKIQTYKNIPESEAIPRLDKLIKGLEFIVDNYDALFINYGNTLPNRLWFKSALDINNGRKSLIITRGHLNGKEAFLCNSTWHTIKKYLKKDLV